MVSQAVPHFPAYFCSTFYRTSDPRQNDFPQLKYALLGGLGLLALTQRE